VRPFIARSISNRASIRRAASSASGEITESAANLVLQFALVEVSAKVRDVGVLDVEEDYETDLWAGVIPLRLEAEPAVRCPRLRPDIETPAYANSYGRRPISC
jgi:hypothetical protein